LIQDASAQAIVMMPTMLKTGLVSRPNPSSPMPAARVIGESDSWGSS
jgi:hypothetical protein